MYLQPGSDSGTTAVVALIRGKQLIVANAGDSRCVVSERGKSEPLSASSDTFVILVKCTYIKPFVGFVLRFYLINYKHTILKKIARIILHAIK